jgi:hypothetical protein
MPETDEEQLEEVVYDCLAKCYEDDCDYGDYDECIREYLEAAGIPCAWYPDD